MKDKEPTNVTDDFLRTILADDLPPDAEKAMKERLVHFREKVRQTDPDLRHGSNLSGWS